MDPGLALMVRLVAAIGVSLALSLMVGRWVLRLDRRGAGLVGGVCAGVALGPFVLGGLAPGVHAEFMVGGVQQASEAALIEDRLPREADALAASGVSDVAVSEHVAAERARAEGLRREGERERSILASGAAAMAASCGLLAGVGLGRPARLSVRAVLSGCVAGVIGGLAAAVAAKTTLGLSISDAALFGAVLAGGALSSRGCAGSRAYGLGAMAVAAFGLSVFGALWAGVALAALWSLGLVVRAVDSETAAGGVARISAEMILIPACAALTVSVAGTDVSTGGAVLIVLVCVLVGDARLVAMWMGANLFEEGSATSRPLSTWLVRFGRGSAGWQVLLLGFAVASGGIDPRSADGAAMVYAIAGSAVVGELLRPGAYRAMRRFRQDHAGSGVTPR